MRTDRVELEVQVPAADVPPHAGRSVSPWRFPASPNPLALPHHVHDPGVIDPTTRALPLQMEIDNPGERLLDRPGRHRGALQARSHTVPVVPNAAVLMEAGRPYVFVQIGGERFARRFIEVASREATRRHQERREAGRTRRHSRRVRRAAGIGSEGVACRRPRPLRSDA